MNALMKILASLGMLASFGGAVIATVFSLAAGANSTPEQLRSIYFTIGVVVLLAALGVGAALYFLKGGKAARAVLFSLAPLPLMIAAIFLFLE